MNQWKATTTFTVRLLKDDHGILGQEDVTQQFTLAGRPTRRRKWLWTFLVLGACGLGFVAWAIYQGNRDLREAMAEATADDPHWQLADLEAQRVRPPDHANSALVVQEGKRLIEGNLYSQQQLAWDEDIDELLNHPAAQANSRQREALAESMKPIAKAMVEYRKLKDLPYGHHQIAMAPDVVSTLLPHVQDARNAARALRLEALVQMDGQDATAAADGIIATFNAGRSIGDEHFLISCLVRIACDAIACHACERFLAQVDANDATLARLQAAIEREFRESLFLNGIRGERAFGFSYLQYLKENPTKATGIQAVAGAGAPARLQEWLVFVPGIATRSQAALLKSMNKAVDIARLPIEEQHAAFEKWNQESKNLPFLAQQVAPSVINVHGAALRHQAQLRCMQVAIAAERYRLKNNRWPAKLEELVEAKLITAVPLDPYDAKPIRWKAVDHGRIVYAVFANRADDGGNIDREKMNNKDSDIGFRVYDPDQRRQPPRPVKTKEPAKPDGDGTPPEIP